MERMLQIYCSLPMPLCFWPKIQRFTIVQALLNIVNNWCKLNRMLINGTKSNIVHFRTSSVPRTEAVFNVGKSDLEVP